MSKGECKKLTKNEWNKWIGVVGRMMLAYALVFAQSAWAAQNQATKDKPGSPQKAAAQQTSEKQSSTAASAKAQSGQARGEESESSVAEEKSSRDASHEGIKVHGHWTIEVRNPDGSLVRYVEFENSLDPGFSYTGSVAGSPIVQVHGGADYLAALLAGRAATPTWAIRLAGPAGISNLFPASTTDAPCVHTDGLAQCEISNPLVAQCQGATLQAGLGCNLTVSTLGTPPSTLGTPPSTLGTPPAVGPIQLSGSVAATQNGHVSAVATIIYFPCGGATIVTNCPITGAGFSSFTSSNNFPGAPIAVSAGQTIAVTVTISFS